MKIVFKLWLLKTKGSIRNLFRSKVSAAFTILLAVIYGIAISSMFFYQGQIDYVVNKNLHLAILVFIGFLALLVFSSLMQPKKALFYEEDAFYLFSGPFSRKQVMTYLTIQGFLQSLLMGLITIVVLTSFNMGAVFDGKFILLAYFGAVLMMLISLYLTDYLYILSIGDAKYKKIATLILGVLVAIVVVILGLIFLKTRNYQTLLLDFMQSPLFYGVPFFGWLKLGLVAFVEQNYLLMAIGFGLLIVSLGIIYSCLISYKGNFYEQALLDSAELTKQVKAIKAGKQNSLRENKVNTKITGHFLPGAYAVMSKNILIMKKTKSLVSINDLFVIGLYVAIAIFTGLGFGFFVYLMVLWVFGMLQNSHLAQELKNYQIYLIPDHPIKKLIATILPTFIKTFILAVIGFIVVGIYYQESLMMILMYILNIFSYISIFISGSVLSLKILRSRSNVMLENLMRMLIMVLAALPSIVVMVIIISFYGLAALNWSTYCGLVVNIVVAMIILFSCKGMMNGHEISSD